MAMTTICDINDKLDKAGLGGAIKELPFPTDVESLGNGNYFALKGNSTNAPSTTQAYIYEVFRSSPTDAVIMATDIQDGHKFMMAQHSGTWLPAWKKMSTDLSNYYTKPQTDAKINSEIPLNAHTSTVTRNGTIKTRLSGTTLYMTNNGHDA